MKKNDFKGWPRVATILEDKLQSQDSQWTPHLDDGQRASVLEIARRLREGQRITLIADEVGMGKTRIAAALIHAVKQAGGRSAVVLPAGVGAQWQAELQVFDPNDSTLLPLRSYEGFIAGFYQDDDAAEGVQQRSPSGRPRKSKRQHLLDRRKQRELPQGSWMNESTLLISHNLASMTFPQTERNKGSWRRELLPAIQAKLNDARRQQRDRGSRVHTRSSHKAAEVIVPNLKRAIPEVNWPQLPLRKYHEMDSSTYKEAVLPMIGYGLGAFDLVVIDEAHKARGMDSGLSQILDSLLWKNNRVFCLGMTATPVELDAKQWIDTLERMFRCTGNGLAQKKTQTLLHNIEAYAESAARLQVEPLNEPLVQAFEQTAHAFTESLNSLVIRRDKRSADPFREFRKQIDDGNGDYRQVIDLEITPTLVPPSRAPEHARLHAPLSIPWLRRFCAAEALSLLPQESQKVKRMRLTIAQGHSLDAVSNHLTSTAHAEEEAAETEAGRKTREEPEMAEEGSVRSVTHAGVWLDALDSDGDADLHAHPSLQAAIALIESYTERGEKVLVFGRYIKPIRVLNQLLDARAMLRRLSNGEHWPGSTLTTDVEAAVAFTLQSKSLDTSFSSVEDVKDALKLQYEKWRNEREHELSNAHQDIRKIGEDKSSKADADEERQYIAKLLLDIWKRSTEDAAAGRGANISHLLQALEDFREDKAPWTADTMLHSFNTLLEQLNLEDDTQAIGTDTTGPCALQKRLDHYLLDEYANRESSFSRLMYGKTDPLARRRLQAAFNRRASWPMVLLAQSKVGREGLNLHEACRTVVLLHAEWNPGVVEQQVGRIDRKNSQWIKDWETWKASPRSTPPPRIRIHPIIIRGTYDDMHWQILKSRWQSLRAQLHGDVLPYSAHGAESLSSEKQSLINRIKAATPDFSPLRIMNQSRIVNTR